MFILLISILLPLPARHFVDVSSECVYFFRGCHKRRWWFDFHFQFGKKKKTKYNFEWRKKNCRLLHVEYAVNRLYFLQPKGILFAVHAFYRKKKCRLEACIGVGKMGGVRLNTCQYCEPPPPHSLSSNKFFFISFVIYLWLIMQRRKDEPHRKTGVGDFSVVYCGRRRDRYSATHRWRWWRRKNTQ